MKKSLLSLGLLSLIFVGCGNTDKFGNFDAIEQNIPQMKKLSSAEIKELVTDKTIDFHVKGKVYSIKHENNGNVSGSGLTGTWNMKENGIKCMDTDKGGLSCVNIYKSSDNKYYTTRPDKTKIVSAFIVE